MDREVVLTGACPWWGDAVREARWGEEPAVAWLGAEVDDPGLGRLRDRAAPWIGRRHPAVLPLLGVSRAEGRACWVYAVPDGVSAQVLGRSDRDGLPLRVAVELCGRVAESLAGLGAEAVAWPGPELHHVLVSPDGRVALTHFAGPGPRSPARREPHGREDEVALVWRLGVFLAELLTGLPPQPATDPAAHDAAARRLAIRLLARQGPPAPDAVRTWLAALLAWEPLDRPALVRIVPGLAELAASLPGPDLRTWARERVPGLRAGRVPPSVPPPPTPPDEVRAEERRDRTEEMVVPDLFGADDDTALSAESEAEAAPRSPPEQGTIPVGVGPPAEVLRRLRRTPSAPVFRDESGSITVPPVSPPPPPPRYGPLIAGSLAGLAALAAITAWLLTR